jgi:hypothetical protein
VRPAVSNHRDHDRLRRSSSMVAGDNSTLGAVKAEPSGRASRPGLDHSSLQDHLEEGQPRRARAPARRHLKVPIAAFGGANKPLTRDASSGMSIERPVPPTARFRSRSVYLGILTSAFEGQSATGAVYRLFPRVPTGGTQRLRRNTMKGYVKKRGNRYYAVIYEAATPSPARSAAAGTRLARTRPRPSASPPSSPPSRRSASTRCDR